MFDNNIDRYTSDGLIHDNERLKELQSLPLSQKIGITIARITEFVQYFGEDGVYVSVSGGKDSAVLWDITHKLFPNAVGVFSDTGLEYPEVREYAMNIAIDVVKPKMSFAEVIKTYGYPVASKEISSAIYYARRNKLPKAEREREREQSHKQGIGLETDGAYGATSTSNPQRMVQPARGYG